MQVEPVVLVFCVIKIELLEQKVAGIIVSPFHMFFVSLPE